MEKKLGLDDILKEIKDGFSPSKISKKYKIPKQTLSYSVGKLKKLGCIEKLGYGTWRYIKDIPIQPKDTQKVNSDIKEIRGHAFIWKIKFIQNYEWEYLVKRYKKKKLTFNTISSGKILRTMISGRKIWLTKTGLIIYEPMDFIGKSSFSVKGKAVFEMDRIVKELIKELGQKFKPYVFTTSREHYAIIKNLLAKQYNERNEKLIIRNEEGTAWLWIDDSKGLGELETNEAVVNRKMQNWWNSNKKDNFRKTPEYIDANFKESALQIRKNAEHLEFHAENMRTHINAIRELAQGVREMREEIKKMREERSKQ